ncbi:MAG: GNAT family N-acetyltransferase [Thermoplasmata archaeon]|nr:MAG: GNAT family N-acetyltransferase [Thermoplasmata archaeon]
MSIQNLFRKIVRNIEDFGALATAIKGVCYLFKPIYENRIYTVYGVDLCRIAVHEVESNDFYFRIVRPNDHSIIKQIVAMEEWLCGRLACKLRNQSLCIAAMDRKRVAGFNLISFNEVYIPLLKLTKSLKQDEAWSEQISVHKNCRRKCLATALRYRVFSELKKRDVKMLYGGTLKGNTAALNLARKVGFKELEDIHFINRFGSKKWCTIEVEKECALKK